MSGIPNTAHQERADLLHYTASIVSLLTDERVLSEAQQYGYKKDYVYRSIGQLAHHLACVGEEDKSLQLADTLLVAVGADQEGTLLTWSTMAENGVKVAEHRIRNSMGLIYGEDGSTVIPEGVDIHDGWTFMNLLSLYRFGDKSVAPYLWRCVEELDEQHLSIGARFAVRIYDAGDESAYNLIKSAAERARSQVLEQPDESELHADDASDVSRLVKVITSALTPARSAMEKAYAQTDIALSYFAVRLLENGQIQQADEIQALMLSGFDNAWLCAKRVELGHDPQGTFAQAAKDYLTVFGEDSEDHISEITDALARGGDPDIKREYEVIYDSNTVNTDLDIHTVASALVALHGSGDNRAHNRLLELTHNPEDSWILISSLEDMGLIDEAISVAKKAFIKEPNYMTGLTLLNLQYDARAMETVQNVNSKFDHSLIDVVYSRSKHLGKLAAHIVELEQ